MFLGRLVNGFNPFSRASQKLPQPHIEGYSYPITPLDVFQVRQALMKLSLPVELILDILDIANYHPTLYAQRDEEIAIGSHHGRGSEASALYLTSPAVPVGNKKYNATHKIKYVKFKTHSADQGWGGDQGCRGTYNGSYTWFEATLLRPFDRGITGLSPNQGRVEMELPRRPHPRWMNPLEARSSLQKQGWDLVMSPDGKPLVWHVQSNLTATHDPIEHEVLWERGKSAQTTDEITGDSNGMGSGMKFLDSFQEGDRIALWVRACFPGWVNNVQAASVEIGFDEVLGEVLGERFQPAEWSLQRILTRLQAAASKILYYQ